MIIEYTVSSSDISPDYPALFQEYIAHSVEVTLDAFDTDTTRLSDEIRDRTLHILSYALRVASIWPDTQKLLLLMVPYMEKSGHRDNWMPYLLTGLQRCEEVNDKPSAAELSLQIGLLYQLRAKFSDAERFFLDSARRFAESNDYRNQARALNQCAFVARLQYRHATALQMTDEALKLLAADDIRRATSYTVRGWVAVDQYEYREAEAHFIESLRLWQLQGDKRQIANRLRDLATVQHLQQRYPEAIQLYQSAIDLFAEVDDPFGLAVAQMNLGMIHWKLGELKESLELLKSAVHVFQEFQDIQHLAMVHNNLGIVQRDLQAWTTAYTAFRKSLEYWNTLGNADGLINVLDELGMTFWQEGQLEQARETFEEAITKLIANPYQSGYEQRLRKVQGHLEEVLQEIFTSDES